MSGIALALSVTATAHGQGRTDVVTLANGDRITGEIVRVERGRLEFKTDDAGTLYDGQYQRYWHRAVDRRELLNSSGPSL